MTVVKCEVIENIVSCDVELASLSFADTTWTTTHAKFVSSSDVEWISQSRPVAHSSCPVICTVLVGVRSYSQRLIRRRVSIKTDRILK